MELLIGTNNPSKLAYYRDMLSGTGVICRSPGELGLVCDAPETASDAAGNALEKALAWHRASGLPVLAEDSGLVFLDLPADHPHQPGVHVRRINGVSVDDVTMRDYYMNLAHQYGGALRSAWQTAHCLLYSPEDYAIRTDDSAAMQKRAFLLTDRIHGDITPGWPLECIREKVEHPGEHDPNIDYWPNARAWMVAWIQQHEQIPVCLD